MNDASLWQSRWLQDLNETAATNATTTSSSSNSTDDTSSGTELHEAEVLRNTAMVYGSILLIVWLVFCWIRRRFPRPFTVRKWTTKRDLKTPLADDQYGFFSWAWMIHTHTDDEILNECGMDALCFLRTLRMGYKLCLLGVFNSLWLFPLYATARTSDETAAINDRVVELTVSHVPSESPRLVGTVLAAYMLFGYCMYMIVKEFEWFTAMRHKFLRVPKPRNYTVYVQNIPKHCRTNAGLEAAFSKSFSQNAVLEAQLRIKASNLATVVQKRQTCLLELETALELEGKGKADATQKVEQHALELTELNKDISQRIDEIQEKRDKHERERRFGSFNNMAIDVKKNSSGDTSESTTHRDLTESNHNEEDKLDDQSSRSSYGSVLSGTIKTVAKSGLSRADKLAKSGLERADKLAKSAVTEGFKQGASMVNTAVLLVNGTEDGDPYSAGFLTFKTLSTTNAARQMVHNGTPFQMKVLSAPDPDDIFWSNVGRSHKDLQFGKLFSMGATTLACLFWTIPMTFFSSLSSVEGLKEQFDWVEDAIEFMPVLEPILQQLAPFLVIAFNSLLPYILQALSMFEGPVSGSVVEASTFSKLSAFMIIQTFFVSALSGGLLEEIKTIVEDPLSAIDLLANTLPAQSTYFIQIAFVGTVIFIAMENLRVVALVNALIRKCVGPKRTEKQRQTTYFGIRPLADPVEFEHAANMAQITVLYFMILLVFQTIAPLTSYVLGFCFFIMRPAFLHQFVYVYPTSPDSGGVIWTSFIKILMACMLIAEFTIVGLMGLKKAAIATPMMMPLIVVTMLFNAYIRQEHFRVAEFLPSNECLKIDQENEEGFDLDFLKGQYLQEELREKEVLPDYLSADRAVALGLVPQAEPVDEEIPVIPNSELSNVEESPLEDAVSPVSTGEQDKWFFSSFSPRR